MARSPANTCPACKLPNALVVHCKSPACPWLRHPGCRLVLDPCSGRGIVYDEHGNATVHRFTKPDGQPS